MGIAQGIRNRNARRLAELDAIIEHNKARSGAAMAESRQKADAARREYREHLKRATKKRRIVQSVTVDKTTGNVSAESTPYRVDLPEKEWDKKQIQDFMHRHSKEGIDEAVKKAYEAQYGKLHKQSVADRVHAQLSAGEARARQGEIKSPDNRHYLAGAYAKEYEVKKKALPFLVAGAAGAGAALSAGKLAAVAAASKKAALARGAKALAGRSMGHAQQVAREAHKSLNTLSKGQLAKAAARFAADKKSDALKDVFRKAISNH